MLDEIDAVLRKTGGVATRARLQTVVTRNQFDHEVRRGYLVAPFPRAWCRPWDADDLIDRAALTSVGPPAALGPVTALRRWQLLAADPEAPVDVIVPSNRGWRDHPGLRVRRLVRFPPLARHEGLLTVHPTAAAVASWPLLPADTRRTPLITGVRTGLLTPADLTAAAAAMPRLPGRADVLRLVALLADGCESELEIWGLLHVFDVPGLRHAVRQHWLRTRAGRYRIDVGYLAERVAVELDGWGSHSSREQRENDMRRDAALAAIGWVTVRFSYRRLHDDIDGCRRDLLATLAARR